MSTTIIPWDGSRATLTAEGETATVLLLWRGLNADGSYGNYGNGKFERVGQIVTGEELVISLGPGEIILDVCDRNGVIPNATAAFE